MTEGENKPPVPFWAKGSIVGGVVILIAVAGWAFLPDIAAFGLRYEISRGYATRTLRWLGPRAVRQLLGSNECHRHLKWDLHIHGMCKDAEEDADVRRLLLSSLKDVDARDPFGATLLHWAANLDCASLAEALLEKGADINALDGDGRTPLHLAASSGATRIVEMLASKGADVSSRDGEGRTPLDTGAERGHDDGPGLREHTAKVSPPEEAAGGPKSPYASWDEAALLAWAAQELAKGFQPDPTLMGKDALLAEARALLHELHSYDLDAAPHHTDGRTDFQEAEWPVMALCYTGYALCNFAQAWPEFREAARKETAWLLNAVATPAMSGFMKPHFGEPFPEDGDIGHSAVFLHGHYLYLAVRYREAFGAREFDPTIHRVASALARDFGNETILDSYRGMTYLSDNCPALAALRRYDAAFGEDLSEGPVSGFLAQVREHYLDEATGLMASYVDPAKKEAVGGPRGIAVMYALAFLPDADRAFAAEQWGQAKEFLVREATWVVDRLAGGLPFAREMGDLGKGLYVCLEHPDVAGTTFEQRNEEDGDSGPVVLGVGTSASAFLIAAAHKAGEHDLARGVEDLAVAVGNPKRLGDRLYYAHMFHPVGQAVVLYGKSLGIGSERGEN